MRLEDSVSAFAGWRRPSGTIIAYLGAREHGGSITTSIFFPFTAEKRVRVPLSESFEGIRLRGSGDRARQKKRIEKTLFLEPIDKLTGEVEDETGKRLPGGNRLGGFGRVMSPIPREIVPLRQEVPCLVQEIGFLPPSEDQQSSNLPLELPLSVDLFFWRSLFSLQLNYC
ncbi:hypothetical protein PV433_17185 [Paenibacillus sp. GYB004]|uniref:hypothetical protein n=1 Tax=Paenibacillus sp. GYB004 TaxID=2994393 RepID=UPI002F968789